MNYFRNNNEKKEKFGNNENRSHFYGILRQKEAGLEALSEIEAIVATKGGRNHGFSWNLEQKPVPLHQILFHYCFRLVVFS